MSEIEYEVCSDPELAKNTEPQQRPTKTGWQLTAPCPRCTHLITTFVPREGYVVGLMPSDEDVDVPAVATFPCNCTSSHAGRPKAAHGCGYYWSFEISA